MSPLLSVWLATSGTEIFNYAVWNSVRTYSPIMDIILCGLFSHAVSQVYGAFFRQLTFAGLLHGILITKEPWYYVVIENEPSEFTECIRISTVGAFVIWCGLSCPSHSYSSFNRYWLCIPIGMFYFKMISNLTW